MANKSLRVACVIGTESVSWLLALRPLDWREVIVVGQIPAIWKTPLINLWKSRMKFVVEIPTDPPRIDALFAGSDSGDSDTFPSLRVPTIYASKKKSLRCPYQVVHSKVGGVTTAISYFGVKYIAVSLPTAHGVPQRLSSVIDHSRFVGAHTTTNQAINPDTELLPAMVPRTKILLPRGHHTVEKGARSLSNKEMLLAWDIPRHLHPNSRTASVLVTALIPVKVTSSVIEAVLPEITAPTKAIGTQPLPPLPAPAADARGTHFPDIGSWLSRKWIDPELISKEAKKSDNAEVPIHLWDLRVCEPLNVDATASRCRRGLQVLRRFLMDKLKWNVIVSFKIYMRKHPEWNNWLSNEQHHFFYPWLSVDSLREFRRIRYEPHTAKASKFSWVPDWLKPVPTKDSSPTSKSDVKCNSNRGDHLKLEPSLQAPVVAERTCSTDCLGRFKVETSNHNHDAVLTIAGDKESKSVTFSAKAKINDGGPDLLARHRIKPDPKRNPGRGGCPIRNRILRASKETGIMFSDDYRSPPRINEITPENSITCNGKCNQRGRHDVQCLSTEAFADDHLEKDSDFALDLRIGIHAIQHYLCATWWKWDAGSGLLFWRFPTDESRLAARDGWPVWWMPSTIPMPSYKKSQAPPKQNVAEQLAEKVSECRMKNYIAPCGENRSDIDYFAVPKVTDDKGNVTDIRVVYNATSCKLNAKVWAPNFWMPTVDTPLRSLSYGYWSVDFDIGEMFLNFPLPRPLQNLAGVRMEGIKERLSGIEKAPPVVENESWTRYLFGYRASPFCTIKLLYHAEEQIKGCPKE